MAAIRQKKKKKKNSSLERKRRLSQVICKMKMITPMGKKKSFIRIYKRTVKD